MVWINCRLCIFFYSSFQTSNSFTSQQEISKVEDERKGQEKNKKKKQEQPWPTEVWGKFEKPLLTIDELRRRTRNLKLFLKIDDDEEVRKSLSSTLTFSLWSLEWTKWKWNKAPTGFETLPGRLSKWTTGRPSWACFSHFWPTKPHQYSKLVAS